MRPAVFFDRDGTLISAYDRRGDPRYHKIIAPISMAELVFEPYLDLVMEKLRNEGYLRIMITNQPDVAHGFLTEEAWQYIHDAVLLHAQLDDWTMCRHRSEDNCPRKKPSPRMLEEMADKWNIDLPHSYMVGDTKKDVETGRNAGCRTILIRKPYNEDVTADIVVPFLALVPEAIVSDIVA